MYQYHFSYSFSLFVQLCGGRVWSYASEASINFLYWLFAQHTELMSDVRHNPSLKAQASMGYGRDIWKK